MEHEEVAAFFRDAPVEIEGNDNLREPQRDGYAAALEHFTTSQEHAILQIPVGCGKTGLMGVLPFRLAKGRVLIIAPNLEIREGVARELNYANPDCFWLKAGVIRDFSAGPHLAVLTGQDANIHDCQAAHIVVANIQQLASSADRWLPQFPDNFFDLILIDEGHHNVAASWQRVFDRFSNAKVVSLTATPFRSDGNEVAGQNIYRYPFARAMNRGYIKRLQAVNVAPSEIFFTYRDDEYQHTLEEVLELREEEWFRRGVALSRETNISIVDASVQCLRRLRATGTRHQIIGAACSINHAREIASMYRERGYQADAIDSRMRPDEREAVLRDLRNSQLDAIIQIQVLGEGFDHPPLSVAAIFRPFRSLSPYVQFVGRIMRVLRQNAPLDLDNEGFVVSHIGLQQDERWDDFRRFDREDQLLFANLIGGDEGAPQEQEEDGPERRRRVRPDMVVLDQIVDRFITDTFLDPTDEGALDELMQQIPQLLGVQPEEIGLTRDDLAARILAARQRAELTPERIPVQPQQLRQQRRRRLDEETRSVAGRIIQSFRLAPQGRDLARLFPRLRMSNNLGIAIRLMHQEVNEAMGFSRGTRPELTSEQLEQAIQELDDVGDRIQERIREAMEHVH